MPAPIYPFWSQSHDEEVITVETYVDSVEPIPSGLMDELVAVLKKIKARARFTVSAQFHEVK